MRLQGASFFFSLRMSETRTAGILTCDLESSPMPRQSSAYAWWMLSFQSDDVYSTVYLTSRYRTTWQAVSSSQSSLLLRSQFCVCCSGLCVCLQFHTSIQWLGYPGSSTRIEAPRFRLVSRWNYALFYLEPLNPRPSRKKRQWLVRNRLSFSFRAVGIQLSSTFPSSHISRGPVIPLLQLISPASRPQTPWMQIVRKMPLQFASRSSLWLKMMVKILSSCAIPLAGYPGEGPLMVWARFPVVVRERRVAWLAWSIWLLSSFQKGRLF